MAITVSNRGAITELPTVAVHNMAAAVGISTVMVPPTVTLNKHRNRRHSRRRTVSGNGSGTGITWFAPASEHKRRWRHPNARSFLSAPRQAPHAAIRRGGSRRLGPWHLQALGHRSRAGRHHKAYPSKAEADGVEAYIKATDQLPPHLTGGVSGKTFAVRSSSLFLFD